MPFAAKYAGRCSQCGGQILVGDMVDWDSVSRRAWHVGCSMRTDMIKASRAVDSDTPLSYPAGQEIRPYQRAGAAFALKVLRRGGRGVLIADEPGLGKEQPVDAPVLTPSGWRLIGDLFPGDLVIGKSGKPARVMAVYRRGQKPIYRLTASDGSSIESGLDHLWTVGYHVGGKRFGYFNVTTEQLLRRPTIPSPWRKGAPLNLALTTLYQPMLSASVDFGQKPDLPLPPYTYGMLVANGSCSHTGAQISNHAMPWQEIRGFLLAEGMNVSAGTQIGQGVRAHISGLMPFIPELNLNVRSNAKRLDRRYFLANPNDRIALLQGLMDADGSISLTRNKLTYHTTSHGLALDVQELVEGLGGISSVRTYDRSRGDKPTEFQVRMRLPIWAQPFRATRKASRYNPGRYSHPCRTISKVEYSRIAEAVCISVAADDGLYIAEHCIPTHNTIESILVMNSLQSVKTATIVC